ncbi:GerAB/ArcD/ProY family transporter [Paenibacillus sp. UMB4589-SE434]|uniref:GerAB/ArcD/ProY family transporter n=1 Tax=Paenibacillus sp. UMB4589-SE434 TaxID=3046314 RepID=UPI002550F977|nr:GerAB/ArcD/ProY family transporter [Paenibacillus sp. UMB4589-SE434]MDK8179818.1 GerAB/ArcD/ProY family transporter [Paenibacillus sp. UMB4589-SE434]
MWTFTPYQMVRLWMIYLISTPLAFLLGQLLLIAEYEGWITILLSCCCSVFIVSFAVKLASYDPQVEWGVFGERIIGKWLHKMIMMLIVFYCMMLLTVVLTAYRDFFGSTYLPGTPDWVVTGGFLVCVAVVSRSGLQTIVFMADGMFILIFGVSLLTLFFLPGSVWPDMSIALVTHWNGTTIWKSVLFVTPWFAEMMLVLIMLPHFQLHNKAMKYVIITKISSCVLIMLYWLITLFVFGPHLGGHLRFPLMELIRFVEIGNIIENLDPIMISLWSSSLFIKCVLLLYMAAHLLAQVFKLPSHRPFTFLLATLVYVFANGFIKHPAEFGAFVGSSSFAIFLLGVQLVPLLYLIINKVRSCLVTGDKS